MSFTQDKFLTTDEYDELYTFLYPRRRDQRWLFFLTCLFTGGRNRSEVLVLTKDNLIPDRCVVHIITSKQAHGGKSRDIPVPKWLFDLLWNRPDHQLFTVSYQRLYQLWVTIRPKKKNIHSLRHTFAVRLCERCRNPKLVQYALGHKRLETTQIYIDYVHNQTQLREAFGLSNSGEGLFSNSPDGLN